MQKQKIWAPFETYLLVYKLRLAAVGAGGAWPLPANVFWDRLRWLQAIEAGFSGKTP